MRRAVMCVVALVALASCGSGGKSTGASTTVAATSSVATTSVATTLAPSATEAPTSSASSSTSTSTTSSTTSTTTTTVAPTTTVDPVADGQTRYFAISSTYNAVWEEAHAQFGDNISASEARPYCALLAPAEEDFARAIQAGPWPEDAQDEAATLAQASAAEAGNLYVCANAASGTAALTAMGNGSAASDASSAMRLALGLPIER